MQNIAAEALRCSLFGPKRHPLSISIAPTAQTPWRIRLKLVVIEAQVTTLASHAELKPLLIRVLAGGPENTRKSTIEALQRGQSRSTNVASSCGVDPSE